MCRNKCRFLTKFQTNHVFNWLKYHKNMSFSIHTNMFFCVVMSPHTSSPRQSGGPAALPRAEHHRSHAQQSKRLHHASLCSNKWELFAGNQLASDSEDLTFFIVLLLRNCYEMNGFGVFETAAALSEWQYHMLVWGDLCRVGRAVWSLWLRTKDISCEICCLKTLNRFLGKNDMQIKTKSKKKKSYKRNESHSELWCAGLTKSLQAHFSF